MVLEGELTLTVDDKKYVLTKDDAIDFCASSKHTYLSSGDTSVKAICINHYPV